MYENRVAPILTATSVPVHSTVNNPSGLNYASAWEYIIQVQYGADAYLHHPPMQATVSDAIGHDLYASWLMYRNVGSDAQHVYEDPRSAMIQYEKLQPLDPSRPDLRQTVAYRHAWKNSERTKYTQQMAYFKGHINSRLTPANSVYPETPDPKWIVSLENETLKGFMQLARRELFLVKDKRGTYEEFQHVCSLSLADLLNRWHRAGWILHEVTPKHFLRQIGNEWRSETHRDCVGVKDADLDRFFNELVAVTMGQLLTLLHLVGERDFVSRGATFVFGSTSLKLILRKLCC